jgi:hypothetical protein
VEGWRVVEGMDPTFSFRFLGWCPSYLLSIPSIPSTLSTLSKEERINIREDLKTLKEREPETVNYDVQ